jgi:hypothetical protein
VCLERARQAEAEESKVQIKTQDKTMEGKVEHFKMEFEKNVFYMPNYLDETRQDKDKEETKTKKRQETGKMKTRIKTTRKKNFTFNRHIIFELNSNLEEKKNI